MRNALVVVWIAMVVMLLSGVAWSQENTESTAKSEAALYSPFSEPRPKIPQEIIDDKRLDQKVKIFVKSKNMRELFRELSAKTGVKIAAGRDVQGDRPIVYFHAKPLRDVMTEISGHYGYRWLISGKRGEYEYELFEDIKLDQRRKDIIKAVQREQNKLLLDFTKKCIEDESFLGALTQYGSGGAGSPYAGTYKAYTVLLSRCGMDFLADVLEKESVTYTFGELPAQMQTAFTDWIEEYNASRKKAYEEMTKAEDPASGRHLPPLKLYDASNLASSSLRFRRVTQGLFGMPMIQLEMDLANQGTLSMQWPTSGISEDQIRRLLGKPKPETASPPLPDDPKITCTKQRWATHGKYLILGDVLEAIAQESVYDLIADYHYQDSGMSAFTDMPLRKTVEVACERFEYVYQAKDGIIRLRPAKWFSEGPPVEPPAELLGRFWKEVETNGGISLDSVLEMALLPDDQMRWAGFRQMPGAEIARNRPATLRVWASLNDDQKAQAQSNEGLLVKELADDQMPRLTTWMNAMGVVPSPEELSKAVIRISARNLTDIRTGKPNGPTIAAFSLDMADGRKYPTQVFLQSLPDELRKGLIAQRKADAEADIIELTK